MEQQRRHIWYFDYLRLFAAAGVVYMHVAAPGLRAGVLEGSVTRGWHALNLLTSLAFSAVPLFFMISGYLLLSDPATRRVDVLFRRRLPRLAVPLTVWTALSAWWLAAQREGDTLKTALSFLGEAFYYPLLVPLWFMYTLIVLYLLSPFLYGGVHGLTPGGRKLALGIIAAVSLRAMAQALLPPEGGAVLEKVLFFRQMQALGGNLLLMLLGWFLGSREKKVPTLPLALTAGAAYLVIVCGTWLRSAAAGTYDQAFQNQSAGFEVLLACCLFLLAKQNLDRPARWAGPLVELTMPVYLMHSLVLRVFGKHDIEPLRFPGVARLTALTLLLCFLLSKTLSTVPGVCFLTTGLRFSDASKRCSWIFTLNQLRKKTK